MIKQIIEILLISLMMTACSNIKPYQATHKNNFFVNSKTDNDVKSSIDIYQVDKACKYIYKGTVSLEQGKNKIGLKNNEDNYLVVSFTTSSFWASSTSSMSQDMMIKPDKGYTYKLDLSYLDNIYNIELKKTQPGSNKTITIDTLSPHRCQNK